MDPKSPDTREAYEPPRVDELPELSRSRRLLPCVLTADEILDRTAELVRKTKERELRQEGLRQWKAGKAEEQKVYEAEITHLSTDTYRLARTVESGHEDRTVEVAEFLTAGANVVMLRLDTGELLATRAATEAELQTKLPL